MKNPLKTLVAIVVLLGSGVLLFWIWKGLGQRSDTVDSVAKSAGIPDEGVSDPEALAAELPVSPEGGLARRNASKEEGMTAATESGPCLQKLRIAVRGLPSDQLEALELSLQLGVVVESESGWNTQLNETGSISMSFAERLEESFVWPELSEGNSHGTAAEVCLAESLRSEAGQELYGIGNAGFRLAAHHPLFRFREVVKALPVLGEQVAFDLAVELQAIPLMVLRGRMHNGRLSSSGIRSPDISLGGPELLLVALGVRDGLYEITDLASGGCDVGRDFELRADLLEAMDAQHIVLVVQDHGRRPLTVQLKREPGLVNLGDLYFPEAEEVAGAWGASHFELRGVGAVLMPVVGATQWRLNHVWRRRGMIEDLLWTGSSFEVERAQAKLDEQGRFAFQGLGPFRYALNGELFPLDSGYPGATAWWSFGSSQADQPPFVVQAPQSGVLLPMPWAYVGLSVTEAGERLGAEEYSELGVIVTRDGKGAECPLVFRGEILIEVEPNVEYRVTIERDEGSASSNIFRSPGVAEFGEWKFDLKPATGEFEEDLDGEDPEVDQER